MIYLSTSLGHSDKMNSVLITKLYNYSNSCHSDLCVKADAQVGMKDLMSQNMVFYAHFPSKSEP